MLLFVIADVSDDSTVTLNLWKVLIVLAIIAVLLYIFRRTRR